MNKVADTILVPGVFVDIDNSIANTALGESFKTVIIGQNLSTGTATKETLVQVFSASDASAKFGIGSMLSHMFESWFDNNTANEVYAIALEDAVGAVKATSAITYSGTATSNGNASLYIGSTRYDVQITTGDTATVVGDTLVTAITADVDSPVTATNAAGFVTFEAKNGGTVSNQISVRENVLENDVYAAGITAFLSTAKLGTGSLDPDIADAIAALPDEIFNIIVSPYTDATNMGVLKTELERRWGNLVQLDGHAVHAFSGTSSEVVTKGGALNSEHFTVLDNGKAEITASYLDAAAVGGRVAASASVDPARPFRTLPITGMVGDEPTDRRTFSEKSSILSAGISTHVVQPDNTCNIDRLITTYKTNTLGAPDTSYKNTNTMLNLSFLRQSFRVRMLSLYPRHKLADDGTSFGAGQPIATPSSIKGAIIALYEEWIRLGLVEDVDTFAETLVVERDTVNRSRVNVNMQPILIGQLYQFDATIQFIV
jgi:phage tail sheath gpL-like